MNGAQIEKRLEALEKTVAQIQSQLEQQSKDAPADDEIIDGVEYDLTTDVRPTVVFRCRARIVKVETPPAILGLSDEECDALRAMVEDDDEESCKSGCA